MAAHARGQGAEGRPLELSAEWHGRTFRLLLTLVFAAGLFMILGRYHEYAAGPAVVLADGHIDLKSRQSSTLSEVAVRPGQTVERGQVLARFFDEEQETQVDAFEREIETLLLERLRNPSDEGTETALAALQAGYEMAKADLERQAVRAPTGGVIRDLRIRPGQLVRPGEVLLSMSGSASDLSMLALLPGRFRPQLNPGMALRLQIEGYPYAYQHLEIDSIGEEVLGPAEARRLLDPGIADSIDISGPVVFVRARLARSFESDGQIWSFHDGMLGSAEARVRSERLIFTLVPGLRALLGDRHGPLHDHPSASETP